MRELSTNPVAIKIREYRKKNPEMVKKYAKKNAEYLREWRKNNVKHCAEYKERYNKENKDLLSNKRKDRKKIAENICKIKAHRKVYRSIRSGIISKPEHCQVCKKLCEVEGHHHDYLKPLDIVWLCRSCHVSEHCRLKETNKAVKEIENDN